MGRNQGASEMTKPELLKVVEEIEDLVDNKLDGDYEKNMSEIVKILSNRYISPELDLDIKKEKL